LVNNLNYYTGIIFKGYLEGISKGILQGGRYDNLAEKFGKNMDAVVFAINLQEVFDKILTEEFRQINELLLYKDIKNLPQTAEKLRSEGHRLRVEKYSDTLMNDIDKLRKKYKKIYVFEDEKAGEI
jgi:ATP phosphoribosyltransferase regulatory subunit